MKILIAEDDREMALLLERVLRKAGHQSVIAQDGTEAWNLLQQTDAPKLVILDWMMPGMSGVEVCRKLRASDEKIRSYVMLVTAKDQTSDIIRGLDSGADDYLTKPINSQEFLARVRVGQRTLALQTDLLECIEDQALLLRRHNLLGQTVRNRNSVDAGAAFHPRAEIEMDVTIGTVAKSLIQIGVNSKPLTVSTTNGHHSDFSVWSSVLILNLDQVWLDLKLDIERNSAETLFQRVVRKRANSDSDVLDVMGEILYVIQENCKQAFRDNGSDVLTPFLPKGLAVEIFVSRPLLPEQNERYTLSDSDIALHITTKKSPAASLKKSIEELNVLDVLIEPFYHPQNEDVVLFSPGTILKNYHILKLKDLIKSREKNFLVSVIKPSPLSRTLSNAQP